MANKETTGRQPFDIAAGQILADGHLAIWSIDLDSGELALSQGFSRLLGFSQPFQVNDFQVFLDTYLHEDERQDLRQQFLQISDGRVRPMIEHRIMNPADGEVRWMLTRSAGEFDEQGQLLRVHNVSQDITHQKQVEHDLREAVVRFESLTEAAPALVFSSDTTGKATFFNDARWVEYTGLAPGSWMGDGWLQALHPDDRANSAAVWSERVQAEDVIVAEDRFLHVNGQLRHILFHAHPIYDEGRFTGHIGTGTDVTELKQAQQERERLSTALMESKRLEAIGTLASGVAHDFNNQLMAISGFLELAAMKLPDDHDVSALIKQASAAADQARVVTDGLLTFARRDELDTAAVDVAELARRNAGLLKQLLPASVELHLDICTTPLWVSGNEGRLGQLIINLVVNARDAMQEGGRIQVCADRTELDGVPHARLEVVDTGTGMDEATRKRIFEPFFTTKAPGQGTGLGLALVHGVVQSHGGTIKVTSTPGKGTSVEVCLPESPAPEHTKPAPEVLDSRGNGARILLVEDNSLVRESCAMLLQESGYRVVQAADGSQALGDRIRYDVQLAVLDVDLPGQDGVQVAAELRSVLGDIPVVFITGNADNPALNAVSSADPVLTKPVDYGVLLAMIAGSVKSGRFTGSSQTAPNGYPG